MSRKPPQVFERGVDSWYDVIEVTGNLQDTLKMGAVIKLSTGFYTVVGISRRIKPKRGGIVVKLEARLVEQRSKKT